VEQVTGMRQDALVSMETEIGNLSREYSTKKEALDRWHQGNLEILEQVTGRWRNDVDEKLAGANDEIEAFKRRLAVENDETPRK